MQFKYDPRSVWHHLIFRVYYRHRHRPVHSPTRNKLIGHIADTSLIYPGPRNLYHFNVSVSAEFCTYQYCIISFMLQVEVACLTATHKRGNKFQISQNNDYFSSLVKTSMATMSIDEL